MPLVDGLDGVSIIEAAVALIINDPEQFQAWWQSREPRSLDGAIVSAAIARGLVTRQSGKPGMLVLTAKGKLHAPPPPPRRRRRVYR